MELYNTSSKQDWKIIEVELREIFLFCNMFISLEKIYYNNVFQAYCEFHWYIKLINAGFILAH